MIRRWGDKYCEAGGPGMILNYSTSSQKRRPFCRLSNHLPNNVHSTSMVIIELVDIYEGFKETEFTIGIFLDLKKAFKLTLLIMRSSLINLIIVASVVFL